MQLLVDIGNTRIKWAMVSGHRWTSGTAHGHGQDWTLSYDTMWENIDSPDEIVASNVCGEAAGTSLTNWCRDRWAIEPVFVASAGSSCGIHNGYKEAGELGVDRWMAIIGARSVTRESVVVIDFGTAITADLLDREDRYRGGVILPGERMSRRSLYQETNGIPKIERLEASALGLSTSECVHGGVYFSIIGGLGLIVTEFIAALGHQPEVLVTGGGAASIYSGLEKQLALDMQHEPDLVLKGIAMVME